MKNVVASPKEGLMARAKAMKETNKSVEDVIEDDYKQEGEDISPSSNEALTISSELPQNLRNLYYAKPEQERARQVHLQEAAQMVQKASHFGSLPPDPCDPLGGPPPGENLTESRRLSPKDVIINAGKRKRQEALYTAFTEKDPGRVRQETMDNMYKVYKTIQYNPGYYIERRSQTLPGYSQHLPSSSNSHQIASSNNSQRTISQGIASGEMKIDPVTKNYVPNDIFVEAMGPGGILPECPPVKKHSKYRGVTKHRRSGRWESHIWLKETGRQMYLGAYENEEHAAEAYDVAALKIKGDAAKINFDRSKYKQYLELLDTLTLAELVKTVKSQIPPPVRNTSNYRGVTYNTKHGMWEAKYSQKAGKGKSQVSLGLYADDVKAAREFDRAMVRHHGTGASINFEYSEYEEELLAYHQDQIHKLDSASE